MMKNKIIQTIRSRQEAFISYAEYMAFALYDEKEGYYMVNRDKVGKSGDFLTTPTTFSVFAEIMAKYFLSYVRQSLIPPIFYEIGGGTGHFAKAFLESVKNLGQLENIQYYSIEKSIYHKRLIKEKTNSYNVIVLDSINDLKELNGFIFSNELFDAFPVHVIEKKDGNLYEVVIAEEDGDLYEQIIPLNNKDIHHYLEKFCITMFEGQRIEVPLEALSLYQCLTQKLHSGYVVTIDYGYTFEELKHPSRKDGSLRGYKNHQMIHHVLKNPGEIDITYHVPFDAFIQVGEEKGLSTIDFLRQDEFLLKIGILDELSNHSEKDPFSLVSKRNRAIRSLIMPGSMSQFFHVLIQSK